MIKRLYQVCMTVPVFEHWQQSRSDIELRMADMIDDLLHYTDMLPSGYRSYIMSYGDHVEPRPSFELVYDDIGYAQDAEQVIEDLFNLFLPQGFDDYIRRAVASAPVIYGYDIDVYEETIPDEDESELIRIADLKQSVRDTIGEWDESVVLIQENHIIDFAPIMFRITKRSAWRKLWYDGELYYVGVPL